MFCLFVWNLNGREEQLFRKKAVSPMRKKRPTFLAITDHGRSQATLYQAAHSVRAINVQVIRSFS